MTEIKFCGLSRHREVDEAAELGATYVGFVVQAPRSHRDLSLDRANELIDEAPLEIRTVLVTPTDDPDDLRHAAEVCRPDVLQIHGDPPTAAVDAIREDTGVETWKSYAPTDDADAVVSQLETLSPDHEAIVLDAVREGYGGYGETIDWSRARVIAEGLDDLYIVLAGGLDPDNVSAAIEAVEPSVVDVSSGIETDKRKDLDRMRAFARAVDEMEDEP